MATRKKTVAPQAPEVPDEAPHYLDRFGHRHERSEQEAQEQEQADEQMLPALPPAS